MWAIFIAIFGGLYWMFKLGSDSYSSRQADIINRRFVDGQEEWRKHVVDFRTEVQIRDELYTKAFHRMSEDALCVIRTLPDLGSANFDFRSRKKSSFYVYQMILYIQMVKHGKLTSLYNTELGNLLELSLDTRPTKRARIEFGKWVENQLKSAGVQNANLYYTKKDYASFEWEPFIYDVNNAIRVTDPSLESQMLGLH